MKKHFEHASFGQNPLRTHYIEFGGDFCVSEIHDLSSTTNSDMYIVTLMLHVKRDNCELEKLLKEIEKL